MALLGQEVGFVTQPHLEEVFGAERADEDVDINASIIGDRALADMVMALEPGQALVKEGLVIALAYAGTEGPNDMHWEKVPSYMESIEYQGNLLTVDRCWKLFAANAECLAKDFERIVSGKGSAKLPDSVCLIGDPGQLFVEEGARLAHCTLNTSTGPIYIGQDAEVMEGCMVRGPFAMLEGSVLKMGSKIYGATTIGPHCKIGGELNNVIFQGYSNKAHDGFLGNSFIGEWCNLGADTNNSNLKNNYGEVKVWSYKEEAFVETGLQFCGLIMGDHSKCGINTMLNTGTVTGVAANIYGGGFPPKFIPSFCWGGAGGFVEHDFEKAIDTAKRVMTRRGLELGPKQQAILRAVLDMEKVFR